MTGEIREREVLRGRGREKEREREREGDQRDREKDGVRGGPFSLKYEYMNS